MVTRERGAGLVLALAALTVVAGAVLLVASHLQASQLTLRHDHRSAVLDTLTDAAFAEALAGLSLDPNFIGLPSHAYGQGVIASAVGPAGETSRSVIATARYQGWTGRISAEVDVSTGPLVMRLYRSQSPDPEPAEFPSGNDPRSGRGRPRSTAD
jgi:hypothetical protein